VPAAQVFPAILTFADIDRERVCRIDDRERCMMTAHRALLGAGSRRQHFFKSEAVFFLSLVYSGCSASRSPSARSD
jgi:hypothetical protein